MRWLFGLVSQGSSLADCSQLAINVIYGTNQFIELVLGARALIVMVGPRLPNKQELLTDFSSAAFVKVGCPKYLCLLPPTAIIIH